MERIPANVDSKFTSSLNTSGIAVESHANYKKWLRYFLDFCAKHPLTPDVKDQIRPFLEKLRSKNQSPTQCQEAAHAVSLYLDLQHSSPMEDSASMVAENALRPVVRTSPYRDAGYQEKSTSPEWDAVLAVMAEEIKVRRGCHGLSPERAFKSTRESTSPYPQSCHTSTQKDK